MTLSKSLNVIVSKILYNYFVFVAVSVIANQTTGAMYYKGIVLQAREVYCHSNDTIQGNRDL